MKKNRHFSIRNIISKHILNNSKEYILFSLIFVLGIFLGVMFINNIKSDELSEVTTYFNKFIETLKNKEELNNISMLKSTISENIILGIAIWFFGTTVIRNTYSIWNCII